MTEDLDLREYVAERLREGFDSVHEIIEDAVEWAFEHEREAPIAEVRRITTELLASLNAEQADWEATTDCDRLDHAFASLERQRIVARQNFSCCNNCGFAEIWTEVEEAEKLGPIDGYVFYHLQCTETARKTGRLLLAYGCVEDDPSKLECVATSIVTELRNAGLDASWGGTENHPIIVDGIVWRRRRCQDAAT